MCSPLGGLTALIIDPTFEPAMKSAATEKNSAYGESSPPPLSGSSFNSKTHLAHSCVTNSRLITCLRGPRSDTRTGITSPAETSCDKLRDIYVKRHLIQGEFPPFIFPPVKRINKLYVEKSFSTSHLVGLVDVISSCWRQQPYRVKVLLPLAPLQPKTCQ